jgi:hypothetical protein
LVPQIPEDEKMTQKTSMFGMLAPTHEFRAVNGHWHENTYVQEHMRTLKIKEKGNKKKCKTNNSHKKKTGKAKHEAFPKVQDHDCKLRDLV